MKRILRFSLTTVIFTIVNIISNAAMPYSKSFTDINANAESSVVFYLFLSNIWICFTIYYIVSHSNWRGKKLFFAVTGMTFFVQSVITQIETLFYSSAFPTLSKWDILLIMVSRIAPLIVTVPIMIKLFGNRNTDDQPLTLVYSMKKLILSIATLGLVYMLIYFAFGYFVAWQLEDLQIFYSGTASDWNTNAIYPFQFIRGILFTVSVLPLFYMNRNNKAELIISICLIYLCTAVLLIIPNVIFPNAVRWRHFIEMTSSMLLFGLITGSVLFRCRK